MDGHCAGGWATWASQAGGKWGLVALKSVAARIPTGMPVPPATHLAAGQLVDSVVEEAVDGGGHGDDVQTESVDFAEADLHSVPFSPKEGEMRVSSVLHHLVAVSTELQLGAVFTSHQSLQMGWFA